ncbi:MAG: hypothetical protein K2X47_02535 [Bdellovibrionales bacterium]|nr:hypothetical protein [Bdellovibrionales bacterium]
MRTPSVMIFILSLFLFGCGTLFGERSQKDVPQPQVRDVSLKARPDLLEPRRRVIVLPFLDQSIHRSSQVADVARKTLIRQLLSSDQVVIVDPQDFPKDLSGFRKGEEYDIEGIAKIAANLGVAAIIEGKILEVKARKLGDQVGVFRQVRAQHEATIRLRMAATKNSREVFNENRSAQVEAQTTLVGSRSSGDGQLAEDPSLVRESVNKAFKTVAGPLLQILRKLSWEGRIATVSGDRIYINAGRVSGLQMGDILKVMDVGQDVHDPESGELIGRAPGRVKGTIEVISYFGKDGSVAVVHSGSGFIENDHVELY